MIATCRISVPPAGPPVLILNVGFDPSSLTNPEPGVYHVSLLPGLAFASQLSLQATGTKAGVVCNAEAPSTTEIVIYRDRYGSPENGDVWIAASGIGAAS